MTLEKALPEFHAMFQGQTTFNGLWEWTAEWASDDNSTEALDAMITSHYAHYLVNRSPDEVSEHTHIILDALTGLKNKETNQTAIERLRFLKLSSATLALGHFNMTGQFHFSFDIFFKSLYDKSYKTGEDYDLIPELLWGLFLSSSEYIRLNIEAQATLWLGALYYYSRSFSGLNEWGKEHFLSAYILLTRNKPPTEEGAYAISQLYAWGILNNRDDCHYILSYLQKINAELTWHENDRDAKKIVLFQLALTTKINKPTRLAYIRELIDHAPPEPANLLHLYGNYITEIKELEELEKGLTGTFISFNASIITGNRLQETYTRARYFKLLNAILIITITKQRLDLWKKVLAGFYNLEEINEQLLFILPNAENGLIYSFDQSTVEKHHDVRKEIPELIKLENRFLNIVNMLQGGHEDIFVPEKDPGHPNTVYGSEFEKKLTAYFDFGLINTQIEKVSGMCLLSWTNLPLQALMLKSIGKTVPNNLSLKNKKAFESVKRIMFWAGNSMTSDLETEAVKNIFKDSGIEVTVIDHPSATRERFVKEYTADTYDILWIASHGQHAHYSPNESDIHLSADEKISLPDLYELNPSLAKRRLIFLNICEGGMTTKTGEFKNVGFPEALSVHQDVLSHLWMTRPLTAAIFGVLFALEIRSGKAPFHAYTETVKYLLNGKEAVIKKTSEPEGLLTELIEKISYDSAIEWGNIVSWGSGAYYV